MSAYPVMALLIGDAVARGGIWVRRGALAAACASGVAVLACLGLLAATWNVEPVGDITHSLTTNPRAYTLSLGHMQDLTLDSFEWLRGPLALAAVAFAFGVAAAWKRRVVGLALMMVVFFQAARWALLSFDPFLSSRPLAEAYNAGPPGVLVLDDQYYSFSSVVFYTDAQVLLLNGRVNNIEYGSNAPGAPDVFLDDEEFTRRWESDELMYLATFAKRLQALPPGRVVVEAGGKVLLANRPTK